MIVIKVRWSAEADTATVRPDVGRVVGGAPKRNLVVVGASGGEGLGQIRALLSALPSDLDATVLVVLHRPTDRSSHLRSVLARASNLPVRIAIQGQPLHDGVCYIGEPDAHLAMGGPFTAAPTPEHGLRNRSIDLLFSSAAAMAGARVTGVILAGSLSDGSHGLAAIRDAGGAALVQAPRRLQCPGMPRAAVQAVPDAEILADPGEIARRIVELAAPWRLRGELQF